MFNDLKEVCGNCGLTKGAHHGGSSPWPYNYCPGHQSRMDWDNGPGTTFKPTGDFSEVKYDTPAKGVRVNDTEDIRKDSEELEN